MDSSQYEKRPRMLTHPFLAIFALLMSLGIALIFTPFVIVTLVPVALGTFFLGRWNQLMLQYEADGY